MQWKIHNRGTWLTFQKEHRNNLRNNVKELTASQNKQSHAIRFSKLKVLIPCCSILKTSLSIHGRYTALDAYVAYAGINLSCEWVSSAVPIFTKQMTLLPPIVGWIDELALLIASEARCFRANAHTQPSRSNQFHKCARVNSVTGCLKFDFTNAVQLWWTHFEGGILFACSFDCKGLQWHFVVRATLTLNSQLQELCVDTSNMELWKQQGHKDIHNQGPQFSRFIVWASRVKIRTRFKANETWQKWLTQLEAFIFFPK